MAIEIDCDFPGGNIVVERIENDTVNVSGAEVNADSARAFGRDLAGALREYLGP